MSLERLARTVFTIGVLLSVVATDAEDDRSDLDWRPNDNPCP